MKYIITENQFKTIVLNENKIELYLRRRLHEVGKWVEYGLKNFYKPENICGRYESPGELVNVVAEWVAERMYYDYFGDFDDTSKEWERLNHMILIYVYDNYGDKIKENYREDC